MRGGGRCGGGVRSHNRLIIVIDKWPAQGAGPGPLCLMDVIYQRNNRGALAGWSWLRRGEASWGPRMSFYLRSSVKVQAEVYQIKLLLS